MTRICGLELLVLSTLLSSGEAWPPRQKREWIVPPQRLRENTNRYMQEPYIALIRSDGELNTSIRYSLTGPGADREPVGLFSVGERDGRVKIHGLLDREKMAVYYLRGVALFPNGSRAEKDVDLTIKVTDENDCAPVFSAQSSGAVAELSAKGTFVMSVTATDADEEGPHSQISYSIVRQTHGDMFYMERESGRVYVQRGTLDRETLDRYTLTVKGTDMNGASNGNSGFGDVSIRILDVNDNVPFLERSFYECSVEENTRSVEVLRMKALDADLVHSDNWLAVFTIVSGNEAGYFSITTDNATNEGVLRLEKELDHEELRQVKLQVSLSNRAAYHRSVVITQSKTYTVQVNVVNQAEGPRFRPSTKVIVVSEERSSFDRRRVVTNYAAIDSDTLLTATNVRYRKIYDADGWLTVDERTADIRLDKPPDYESKFLVNRTYFAVITCTTNEYHAKTATGTIAIQVEDFNDHCPVPSRASHALCYGERSLRVTAHDLDHYPNAAPFLFTLDRRSQALWTLQHTNDTTAIFISHTTLWPGTYQLFLEIRDQQGKFCSGQVVQVDVCTCDGFTGSCLARDSHTRIGASGLLLLLLGLLLLLLVPLLLMFCVCGGVASAGDFKNMPFDVKEHLIVYNTEGQGDDKEVGLLQVSNENNQCVDVGAVGGGQQKGESVGGGGLRKGGAAVDSRWSSSFQRYRYYHGQRGDGEQEVRERHTGGDDCDGLALPDAFLHRYYSQKARCVEQGAGDALRVYQHEGAESQHDSLEDICHAWEQEEESLAFLDHLGPRFKALAEICSGSRVKTEVTAPPQPRPSHTLDTSLSQTAGASSSSTTALQTSVVSTSTNLSSEKVLVPSQTLMVQQPALFYTSATPVYVLEPRPAVLVEGVSVEGVSVGGVSVEGVSGVSVGGVSVEGVRRQRYRVQEQSLRAGRVETGVARVGLGSARWTLEDPQA